MFECLSHVDVNIRKVEWAAKLATALAAGEQEVKDLKAEHAQEVTDLNASLVAANQRTSTAEGLHQHQSFSLHDLGEKLAVASQKVGCYKERAEAAQVA